MPGKITHSPDDIERAIASIAEVSRMVPWASRHDEELRVLIAAAYGYVDAMRKAKRRRIKLELGGPIYW